MSSLTISASLTLALAGVLASGCGSSSGGGPVTPTAPIGQGVVDVQPIPGSAAPSPISVSTPLPPSSPGGITNASDGIGATAESGTLLTSSSDGTLELRKAPSGNYVLTRKGEADVTLPSEWFTDFTGVPAPSLSADGKQLGILQDTARDKKGKPTFKIYDLGTRKLVASRQAATTVAGGAIEATFGTTPGSIEWTFTRADCELQDIATGKAKCGSCKNTGYASFDPAGKKPEDPRVITKNCVK